MGLILDCAGVLMLEEEAAGLLSALVVVHDLYSPSSSDFSCRKDYFSRWNQPGV